MVIQLLAHAKLAKKNNEINFIKNLRVFAPNARDLFNFPKDRDLRLVGS